MIDELAVLAAAGTPWPDAIALSVFAICAAFAWRAWLRYGGRR